VQGLNYWVIRGIPGNRYFSLEGDPDSGLFGLNLQQPDFDIVFVKCEICFSGYDHQNVDGDECGYINVGGTHDAFIFLFLGDVWENWKFRYWADDHPPVC
jgi:hypothetical protein